MPTSVNAEEQTQTPQESDSFYGLGIAPGILDMLDRLKFVTPTPIQKKAIPLGIEGKDLIGVAQTGTGKTLAFTIPIIQRLAQTGGKALVVLPTRELALQVDEVFQKVGKPLGGLTAVLIGGLSIGPQREALRRRPDVIIATPGRILDHLEQRNVDLSDVAILVLDEADRMLDMGFMPQIKRILAALPKERQTMLFSATMPDDIVHIASRHMHTPLRVEVARPGTTADRVEQELFVVERDQKTRLLEALLAQYHGTVLVFTRTKHGAERVTRAVRAMGHAAAEIHSNRSLAQRRDSLDGFKAGKYRVLVATDIASRGIDVTGIELVVNYDIPDDAGDYVHRIGRTGRAGHAGRAISFATPEQGDLIREIEYLARTPLSISKLPVLPPDRHVPRPEGISSGFGGRPQVRHGSFGGPRRRSAPRR